MGEEVCDSMSSIKSSQVKIQFSDDGDAIDDEAIDVTTDKSTNSKMRIQNLFECLQLKSDNSENDDDELKLRGGLAVADKADDEVERNSSSDDVIESVVVQEDETNNISERTEEEEEKKGLLTPETPVKKAKSSESWFITQARVNTGEKLQDEKLDHMPLAMGDSTYDMTSKSKKYETSLE